MKLAPKAAASFLARPDAACRAVLLYGPDSGLARERLGVLKAALLSGNTDPFAYVELQESALLEDPARLADELSAMSLMGGKRFIAIRDAGDKSTGIIESASAYFHKDAFVAVLAGELSIRSSLRAYFEKQPDCAALACYKDEPRDVREVIERAFAQAGIRAERDAVDFISRQLGNDRYVTRQELEKIILYAGEEKTLSLADAQALVDYNREMGFDDLANAVADRNLAVLESLMVLQKREAVAPVAAVRGILRYFNRLYALRAEVDAGRTVEEVIASCRPAVFFRQVPVMTRHLQGWSVTSLAKALRLLVEAELACKTSDLPLFPALHRRLMQVTQITPRRGT